MEGGTEALLVACSEGERWQLMHPLTALRALGSNILPVLGNAGDCEEIFRIVKGGVCGVDDDEGGGPGSVTGICIAADRGHAKAVSVLVSLGVSSPSPRES